MLLGCYQLSYTRIPDHAAISETVNVAAGLRKHWAKALINGVLRQYQRRLPALEKNLSQAQQQAHPPWLLDALQTAWPDQWQGIVAANNHTAPMCLRINQAKTNRQDYLAALTKQGVAAYAGENSAQAIYLEKACDVSMLPGFGDGLVSVQDEAAQLSARLVLQDQPQRVLDACCAPGGKSCHLLELAPSLELHALELDPQRMPRVSENLERLGLSAKLMIGDGTKPDAWWDGQYYDAILLDAPCSASGVIRRNPDIKTLRRPEDARQLQNSQLALLDHLWPCLKPGGLLVYATCSVLPTENRDTIAAFCGQTEQVEHIAIDAQWGISRDYGRQILPSTTGMDGFYYACLRKMQ
jgi:16S rRNA (cytosine967-C5)-methyltransferase